MMKFYYKQINVFLAIGFVLIFLVGYYFLMTSAQVNFSTEIIVGVLKPLAVLSVCMIPLLAMFLFFQQEIFNRWLKKIVSWYMPILLFLAFSSPAMSGNVLAIERSLVILYGMSLLFAVTIIFIVFAKRKAL